MGLRGSWRGAGRSRFGLRGSLAPVSRSIPLHLVAMIFIHLRKEKTGDLLVQKSKTLNDVVIIIVVVVVVKGFARLGFFFLQ